MKALLLGFLLFLFWEGCSGHSGFFGEVARGCILQSWTASGKIPWECLSAARHCTKRSGAASLYVVTPAHHQHPAEVRRPAACHLLPRGRLSLSMSSRLWRNTSCWSVPAAFLDRAAATREIRGEEERAATIFPLSPYTQSSAESTILGWILCQFLSFSWFLGSPWDFSNFVISDYYCYFFACCYFFFFLVHLFFHLYLFLSIGGKRLVRSIKGR